MLDVGGDDQDVGQDGAREQCGREVLVDHRLDTGDRPVLVAHARDAAAAGGHHDVSGGHEREGGGGVQDLKRLGRGDHPAPPARATVLPGLAVLDQRRGLVGRQVAADRLDRVSEAGVGAVDKGASHQRRGRPPQSARRQGALERTEQQEPDRALRLRDAPVQRHRWDDGGSHLVLHQQVADLGAVAVGEHQVVAMGDQVGDAVHRGGDRRRLVARPGLALG